MHTPQVDALVNAHAHQPERKRAKSEGCKMRPKIDVIILPSWAQRLQFRFDALNR